MDNLENALEANSIDQLRDLLDDSKAAQTWDALRKQKDRRRAVVEVPEELPPRAHAGVVSGGGKRKAQSIDWSGILHKVGRVLPENSVVGILQVLSNFDELERGNSGVELSPPPGGGEADPSLSPGSERFRGNATWKYGGAATGAARVGIEGLKAGEILVMPDTDASLTVHFAMLAGVVTERGGTLSHAAVTARDPAYNIPCVVGLEGACTNIRTGDTICVHGATGIVEVLSRSATAVTPGGEKPERGARRSAL
jgi:phosphohistidine swiveling domain-containing protein